MRWTLRSSRQLQLAVAAVLWPEFQIRCLAAAYLFHFRLHTEEWFKIIEIRSGGGLEKILSDM
jgi:hypothetical protein